MTRFPRLFIYSGLFTTSVLLTTKPAYADSSLAFIAFSGSPTLTVAIATFGIGVLAVILIEMFVIMKVAHMRWPKALGASFVMNIISSLAGWGLSLIMGVTGECYLTFTPIFIIIVGLSLWRYKCSGLFIGIVIFCLLLSFPAIILVLASQDLNIFGLWGCIIIQLAFGFGMTLPIEMTVARWFYRKVIFENTILKANIYSYIFLFLMAPFFWPNPVQQSYESGTGPTFYLHLGNGSRAMRMIYLNDHSTLELLGLKKFYGGLKTYKAEEIINAAGYVLLKYAYEYKHSIGFSGTDIFVSINDFMDEALRIPVLTDESRSDLAWLKLAATMWPQVAAAMDSGDAQSVKTIYLKWIDEERKIKSNTYSKHENKYDPMLWLKSYADEKDVGNSIKDVVDELVREYGAAE